MAPKRQRWQIGDLFLISIQDGNVVLGQVIGQEPDLMRSATIALFDKQYSSPEAARSQPELEPQSLFSVLFVTTNHLDSGEWHVIGNRAVAVNARQHPQEHTRKDGFVGAKVYGSNIVNKFVSAFYGLRPWDDWKDPHFLDSLLISKELKPTGRLVYKN